MVSDAQSALAMLMKNRMAFFAIQSAEMVTMVSVQFASNVAQLVSTIWEEASARSSICSRGAGVCLTGA